MTQEYNEAFYNNYPINSDECSSEPAFKRLVSMPQPVDVYKYALLGLPKIMPLTGEEIPLEFAEDALLSAIAEIEMKTGMNISPVDHWHSEDFIHGKFSANHGGIRLPKWPATKIIKISMKYPNTNTKNVYAEYIYPAAWFFLRKNNVNITPSYGNVTVTHGGAFVPGAGIYGAFFGILSNYQEGLIEVVYTAGFEADKMPANLADLIKTWAAERLLMDLIPILYPQSSVSVSIDGVNQSVGFNISQMLTARLQGLDNKKNQLLSSLMSQYKSVIKQSYIGT